MSLRPLPLLIAFAERRFRLRTVYSAALIMEVLSGFALIATFYFLARLVDVSRVPAFQEHARHGYFAYALSGIALSTMMTRGIRAMSDTVRQGQLNGTLEAIFAAPLRDWEVVGYDGLIGFVAEIPRLLAYVLAGALLGFPLDHVNIVTVFVVLGLTALAFWPIGMLGAAAQLLFRRGDPVTYAVSLVSTLVAGVYFPIELLPRPLAWLSEALPLTHALRALRRALLEEAGFSGLGYPTLGLLGFFVVLSPVSALVFTWVARRARRQGTLGKY
jgi:ABC-2 type transport system permease protein